MRSIGKLSTEREAVILSGVLYVRGIENEVEEDDGKFAVWVHDDDRLAEAAEVFSSFHLQPDAPEFAAVLSEAARLRTEAQKAERKRGSNVITRERIEYERNFKVSAWLPTVLILLSVVVAGHSGMLLSDMPTDPSVVRWFWISEYAMPFMYRHSWSELVEINAGQVWRLVTPIFLHFGILHLLFNMMWLRDLGGFMQNRFGALYLGCLIVAIAIASNLAQFWWGGHNFGGMSGVNYGLFGFLWMRGKFDRFAGWQLNPAVVQTMMVWFFLCFTPLLPGIANGAHLVGLLVGGGWGYFSARIAGRKG